MGFWRRAVVFSGIMNIPAHLQKALGIASPIEEQNLVVAADSSDIVHDALGLSGAEFAAAVTEAQTNKVAYTSFHISRAPANWKYLEISNSGAIECFVCCSPAVVTVAPPTSIGELLAKGWLSIPDIVTGASTPPGFIVMGTVPGLTLSSFVPRFVTEWANAAPTLEGSLTCPSWFTKNQMGIVVNARLLGRPSGNPKFQELFVEAVSELKTKWRFLALYRILEHGFLSEIFQTLFATFFETPRESLGTATKSIEAELKQFLALAQTAALQHHFETIYDEFDRMKIAGNKFAIALDKSMRQSGQLDQVKGKSETGVLIVYKIRCAIVHAGQSSPIFDAYPDGATLLDTLIPISESIALTFLGITIV